MAWSTGFGPDTDQQHHRYNIHGLAQANASTAPFHRIPLIPDFRPDPAVCPYRSIRGVVAGLTWLFGAAQR
jgi:hypothetical protein